MNRPTRIAAQKNPYVSHDLQALESSKEEVPKRKKKARTHKGKEKIKREKEKETKEEEFKKEKDVIYSDEKSLFAHFAGAILFSIKEALKRKQDMGQCRVESKPVFVTQKFWTDRVACHPKVKTTSEFRAGCVSEVATIVLETDDTDAVLDTVRDILRDFPLSEEESGFWNQRYHGKFLEGTENACFIDLRKTNSKRTERFVFKLRTKVLREDIGTMVVNHTAYELSVKFPVRWV